MAYVGLVIAFLLALGLTPLARAVAARWNAVDWPGDRKIHGRPTPLLGGLAVFAAIGGTLLLLFGSTREVLGLLLGGALFLALGLVDDLRDFGAGKLLAEFGVAALVVAVMRAGFHLPWPLAGTLLTVLWIVGVANAFNCLDCADGAAAGAALAAGGAFLAIGAIANQRLEMLLAAAIMGASMGFLPYNLHPARIFLGDAGSLVLGYFLAMLGVMLSPGVLSIPAMAAPAVVLLIPIYDIILVHVLRFRRGERALQRLLTSTGKDHLPHRLSARGLSPHRVTMAIVAASAATGAAGVTLAAVNTASGAILIGLAVVMIVFVLERAWVATVPRAHRTLASAPEWQNPEGP
jgi:UDP-GlcNAc:undecaprenyl-phosphate GlcNAc-1-phosphate transferase